MNLELFSKYRNDLMGIATIMIIVCHAPANGVIMPPMVTKLIQFCGIGVDVFLFLSGFGLYYSLSRHYQNGKNSIMSWYKHRYLRVLVPYLLFTIPVYSYKVYLTGEYSSSLEYMGGDNFQGVNTLLLV